MMMMGDVTDSFRKERRIPSVGEDSLVLSRLEVRVAFVSRYCMTDHYIFPYSVIFDFYYRLA